MVAYRKLASSSCPSAQPNEHEVFIRVDVNEAETGDRQHAAVPALLDVPRHLPLRGCYELHRSASS